MNFRSKILIGIIIGSYYLCWDAPIKQNFSKSWKNVYTQGTPSSIFRAWKKFINERLWLLQYYVLLFLLVTFFVVSIFHLGAIGLWDRTSLFIEFSDSWNLFSKFQNFLVNWAQFGGPSLNDLKRVECRDAQGS